MSVRVPTLVLLMLGLLLLAPGAVACDAAGTGDEGATVASSPADAGAAGAAAASAPDTIDGATVEVGYTLGSPDAPVAVVEFSDFGCPYCGRFARGTLPRITQQYIDEGLVRWRYVPVTFGFPGGQLMGAAAECAADQGGSDMFWRAHDLLYERQVALRGDDARPRLVEWLGELELDTAELDRCIDAPETRERLEAHNQAAARWFVRGTPTFLINGVPMSGALPLEFFQQVFSTVLDPSGL